MVFFTAVIYTMDEPTVLTHALKSESMSSLLVGELSDSVINNSKYISPLTSVGQVTDRNEEDDLFSLDHVINNILSDDNKNVILVGPEGSGKTTALEKLIMDRVKGERLQNFSCVLLFRVKELNCLNEMISLETLVHHHHSHVTAEPVSLILQKPKDVLLVFDDLHLCKQSLDPSFHTLCTDPTQAASLSCLVASLLHGSLLKGASFVAATRVTGYLKCLRGTHVEVLGYLKKQRDAYFSNFFTDPTVANEAIVHVESNLSFYDIYSSPRFCWTVCSMYKSLMDAGGKLPETLSQLYVDILVLLIHALSLSAACNRELVVALGKMASHCFLEQHLSCTREEIESFGLDKFLSSVGIFLQVDSDHSDRCVFSFPSQWMQEFHLAVSFFWDNLTSEGVEKFVEKHKSRANFLDVFLSALSEPVQRRPLETLLGEVNPDRVMDFKCWFRSSSEKILKGCYKDQHHHCFHLLHQAQNENLVKEIITPSARMGISYGDPSLWDCVALNYVVKCLGEMEMLNLYRTRNLTEGQAEALAPIMSLSHEIM